jgi:beta-mannosidase
MQTLNLAGEWTLTCLKNKERVKADVPGDIHSALLAAGKIAAPYWGKAELDVQWVGREDWEYSRVFNVDASLLQAASVCLSCDRLDTIAEVFINGKKAGAGENMFVRHRFEVKPLLRAGKNDIRVRIYSAENAAAAAAKKLPYPIPCSKYPVQSPHRNLVRKAQCHAGWDWGICLMVGGITGGIGLIAASVARIEHVYTTQRHKRGSVDVEVFVEVESPSGGTTELDVTLGGAAARETVTLAPGLNTLKTRVTLSNPELWWPNGHGLQPLYELTVRVGESNVTKSLGLRSLELITKEDKAGLSMYFRVNGRDIFCKGANWIPCDALPQRQTPEHLENLLDSAARANMNMLRVWGGGQYESDAFYELCDQKGLLVWHDFIFSCALYPGTKKFLDNVRQEARYQVKRLRDHACLALWCGNNENVGALKWFEEPRQNRDRYLLDYDHLNEGVLGAVVDECDPTRTFWPSSPCGGRNDFSDCWHSDSRGDMHYWSVWHQGKSFDSYYTVKPRFCSEFGYQSFPALDTIRTYATEEQFNVTTPVMEHHQRNPGGNSRIVEMFTRYFRVPEGFANFVYLSQVQQALAIKTAVEYWRHLQPHCMGALYWQLNDLWPVCSWSSLEYQGKWKLLHHAARRFYAPLMVCAIQEQNRVGVWLLNDQPNRPAATVRLRVLDLSGKVVREEKLAAKAPAGGALLLKEFPVEKLTAKPAETFMALNLESEGVTFQNDHFFTVWKALNLERADVKTGVRALKDGRFSVTLKTDLPAFFVSPNADGLRGEFDDSCFTLLPGEPRELVFTPKQKVSVAEFIRALSVKHLRQTY